MFSKVGVLTALETGDILRLAFNEEIASASRMLIYSVSVMFERNMDTEIFEPDEPVLESFMLVRNLTGDIVIRFLQRILEPKYLSKAIKDQLMAALILLVTTVICVAYTTPFALYAEKVRDLLPL